MAEERRFDCIKAYFGAGRSALEHGLAAVLAFRWWVFAHNDHDFHGILLVEFIDTGEYPVFVEGLSNRFSAIYRIIDLDSPAGARLIEASYENQQWRSRSYRP
jgi:hypothetical protein